jgi:hypothetical protein
VSTVEFTAQVIDNAIQLPSDLRERITGSVRVIIVTPAPGAAPTDMIEQLLRHPLPIIDFVPLSCDKANARA